MGSSPLTRGKLPSAHAGAGAGGLIPAHAGKTPGSGGFLRGRRAHPRSRGENPCPASSSTTSRGSSPLTRGKPEGLVWVVDQTRLIPAHAGKTRTEQPTPPPHSAHPRSRGENVPSHRSHPAGAGSSPLTRGKPDGLQAAKPVVRLIPAHAGKTWRRRACWCPAPAHPRSRGENTGVS